MRRSRLATAILVTGVLLVGACGDDGDESIPMTGNRPTPLEAESPEPTDPSLEATFPTTVTAANGQVTIEAQPESIVSLSPTATEMLFAIDAGAQIVAVDEQSNYPPSAPTEDGLSGFEPNVEAISSSEPDLVVVEGTAAVEELTSIDVPVLQLPAALTLDDSYQQIATLGTATGHIAEATTLVESMQSDISEIQAGIPQTVRAVTAYHEVDDTLYTITAGTFLGQIYQLAGLSNIAADLGGGESYAQISAEQVITDNPDWIFLAYGDHETVTEVQERPGWDQILAVQDDHVVTLDPDIASRWGPRTVDLLETLVETAYPGA